MGKNDLGIDLGTATFVVYKKGEGIVINEPSVVAINKLTGELIAFGFEAKKMEGKTPVGTEIVKPMRDGVIVYPDLIEQVLKHFVVRTKSKSLFSSKPQMVIGIPARTTDVERRAVKEAAEDVGASMVHLVIEPLAAAIGADLDILEANGHMIVDIGGGTTDIAILSLGGTVISESMRVAGEAMDKEIVRYIKRKYRFLIGEATAENLKNTIGLADPSGEVLEAEIRGQDMVNGLPSSKIINSLDIHEAIKPVLDEITQKIKQILESSPPELAADILKNGIVLTGGVARLRGLDMLIEKETGVKTVVAQNPELCVALGTGKLLENTELLQRVEVIL